METAREVARIIKRLEWYADTIVGHSNRRLIAKEAAAALRALLAENAALRREREEWMVRAIGAPAGGANG